MDQFIPGLAAAVQQALQTELPAGFARIVVGDDNFLIFAARRLGHTVGAHNAENVELLIQFANVRAVVIGHHDIPMAVQKRVMETLVIFLWEGYDMATQACDTRNTIQNSTRDIIDNANCNSKAILDFLVNSKMQDLQTENQNLKLAASQAAQNNYLVSQLRPCPTPAYITCNPWAASAPYGACGNCA